MSNVAFIFFGKFYRKEAESIHEIAWFLESSWVKGYTICSHQY